MDASQFTNQASSSVSNNRRMAQQNARFLRSEILRSKRLRMTNDSTHIRSAQHSNGMSLPDDRRPRPRRHNISERWEFGTRTIKCSNCKAYMWVEEKLTTSSISNPRFGLCCNSGQVMLPLLPPTPEFLDLKFNNPNFRDNVRSYNSMFSFTSMGCKIDRSVLQGRGPYNFRISGENAHKIGSLLPQIGDKPKFAQLYIYDTNHKVQNRINAVRGVTSVSNLDESILEGIQSMLNEINPYVSIFRQARDMITDDDARDFHIRIIQSRGGKQYIRPTANEIAALIVGDGTEDLRNRDIIVCKSNGILKRIDETHPSYMPLQYPLLFPFGTDGWCRGIPFAVGSSITREGISMRQFYAFRIQFREEEGNTILQGGRLFQQFVVDCYASIEQNRLTYVRLNQNKLRADLYKCLEDAVTVGDIDASSVGKRFVLPSSFTGGPRNMVQHYQDAMAICRIVGSPDLFITFTCNPKWNEIKNELLRIPGQRAEDRPDIVCRVFRIKLKQLMKDFKIHELLGKTIADIHVIEFQKRGLPHAHILLTLATNYKPNTIEEIDTLICAEIPNKETNPLAYETVIRCMIHGPCGSENPNAPCMVKGKCSKHFPKKFCNETFIDQNGRAIYRRRRTEGVTVNGRHIDNSWVIPYNRDLCVKYDAHINVERCAPGKLIKYLYKYIHKGCDRATFVIEDNTMPQSDNGPPRYRQVDEVKQYLDCRYVSAIESCWRIYEFELQQQYPSVERLQYHLPGEQYTIFQDTSDVQTIVDQHGDGVTMFTKWFEANQKYPHARSLTYAEFPTLWVWNRLIKEWTMRKKRKVIGRLFYAHPNSGERYFLRMMLNKIRGATCYEDLRTVNGVIYSTFKEACIALGLLEDDNEWHASLTEASTWASGSQLRNMFCSMLMFSEVTHPHELWESHWKDLTDDLQIRVRRELGDNDVIIEEETLRNMGLLEIEKNLNKNGRSIKDFPNMPMPSNDLFQINRNRLIREELDYDDDEQRKLFATLHPGLNNEQLEIFNTILHAHDTKKGMPFFVYGSGGTGKTYLWRTLISKFRSEKKIVLSVASSGIAALLLEGGRTAHSRFKIPLNLDETSCCSITLQSELAKLIQETSLIIWDEAPMMSRYAFEAVDRTFQDIMKCNKVFGGKLFVLGGDFRQILPVVPKGGREQTVAVSLQKSNIWSQCRVMHLNTNMRVMAPNISDARRQELDNFAQWIKQVGEGKIPKRAFMETVEPDWIQIPNQFQITNDTRGVQRLIDSIYPNMSQMYKDSSYMKERNILAPKNTDVDELNSLILALLPGEARTYHSADRICSSDNEGHDEDMNPTELLNSLNYPGLPSHSLELKVGAPVVLLRNLNQSLGLCNGTRLIIERLGDRVIEAKIITGSHINDRVFIPRIELSPSSSDSQFLLKRRQFPLKLAFVMTINKSQGQTLKWVGLYLPDPVFTHGQLYVAISRVTSPSGLKILILNKEGIPHDYTKNVVYNEVFNDI